MAMDDQANVDLTPLDRPEITAFLFHPRPETGAILLGTYEDLRAPVDQDVVVGGRFYDAGKDRPVLLFFHGNGEIVAEYDDLAPFYKQLGLNFVPFDYRGYGRSTGRPSVSTMIADAHQIYGFVKAKLKKDGYTGPMILMGRSLGSASVLELAAAYPDEIDGLIIESGFAHTVPLLQLLGVDVKGLGLDEERLRQTEKIAAYAGPTLIIHGVYDHIIPFSDAEDLLSASGAEDKHLLRIDGANHNNVLAVGLRPYLAAIAKLAEKAGQTREDSREP
jgi:pimeloyl-ACP methyl ester carboxylesterase